jgi:hypothetical protein
MVNIISFYAAIIFLEPAAAPSLICRDTVTALPKNTHLDFEHEKNNTGAPHFDQKTCGDLLNRYIAKVRKIANHLLLTVKQFFHNMILVLYPIVSIPAPQVPISASDSLDATKSYS